MKKIQFWSLLIGLVLGSFACVACGDDDDNDKKGESGTSGNITAEELIGNWYLIDENSSKKVCIDVIQVLDKQNLVFTEMKAKAEYGWELRDEDQRTQHMTYTYDGKRITMSQGNMGAEITKENGQYMIQRYEGDQTVGTKIELFKIQKVDEAAQKFALLVASKMLK